VNFLAHSLFAQGDSERLAGQFAGDFVRGSDLSAYSPGMQMGIRMHRFIDRYTDHYPEAIAVRQVFKPPVRRFAGIITDVVFDHYLANEWSTYCDVPLAEHVAHVHDSLAEHHEQLPDGLKRFAAFIKSENVLEGNLDFEGVRLTLHRLSRRSKRFEPISHGIEVVQAHDEEIRAVFNQFFPDLIKAADEHRRTL